MGAGIGGRLHAHGVEVRTSLTGRSEASARRAAAAGMLAAEDDDIAACDMILSIVPPGQALALAERLRPAISRAARSPCMRTATRLVRRR